MRLGLLLLLLMTATAQGQPVCSQALQGVTRKLTPLQQRHLDLQIQVDRLRYLRVNPPKDRIQAAERQLRALENQIRAQSPGVGDDAIAENRVQSIDELYSYFANEKEKYDGFHPSWKWRQYQAARNEQFGKRFEKISLAYLKAHDVAVTPHYEGRLRDGVTLVPDADGSYLNRLAFKLKRRWDINLVISPKNLVAEATDGMYASGTKDVYVSKDLLRILKLETTTRHEIIHAYIDSFAAAGIETPYDAELTALEGKKISSYGTSGYDEYEDASEVATYAQEVFDGGLALRAAGSDPAKLIAEKIQVPAEEGWKLTQAMIEGAKDALSAVQSNRPLTFAMGKLADGRNPAFAYADIPVGDRATLTLKFVNEAEISVVRGGQDVQSALTPVIVSRLQQIIDLDTGMLGLYEGVKQEIAAALQNPESADGLQKLIDSTMLPKQLAFSKMPQR